MLLGMFWTLLELIVLKSLWILTILEMLLIDLRLHFLGVDFSALTQSRSLV